VREFEKQIKEGKTHKEAAAHLGLITDNQDRVFIAVRIRRGEEEKVSSFIKAQGGKIRFTEKEAFGGNKFLYTRYDCLLPIEAIRRVAELDPVVNINYISSPTTHATSETTTEGDQELSK